VHPKNEEVAVHYVEDLLSGSIDLMAIVTIDMAPA
jgi:hypothetical protein